LLWVVGWIVAIIAIGLALLVTHNWFINIQRTDSTKNRRILRSFDAMNAQNYVFG
jgi:hypothetical protein